MLARKRMGENNFVHVGQLQFFINSLVENHFGTSIDRKLLLNKIRRAGKMEMKELIAKEIESVPEPYLMEILDFIRFLETKALE